MSVLCINYFRSVPFHSVPFHSVPFQVLSLPLHGCEIKSGSGLGTRLESISIIATVTRASETPNCVNAACILMTVVQVITLTLIDICSTVEMTSLTQEFFSVQLQLCHHVIHQFSPLQFNLFLFSWYPVSQMISMGWQIFEDQCCMLWHRCIIAGHKIVKIMSFSCVVTS